MAIGDCSECLEIVKASREAEKNQHGDLKFKPGMESMEFCPDCSALIANDCNQDAFRREEQDADLDGEIYDPDAFRYALRIVNDRRS